MSLIHPRLAAVALLSASAALFVGCGALPTQTNTPFIGQAIRGHVHGGSQAVIGAHIYLFAAGTGGYGSPSVSLLDPTHPGVSTDTLGSYVSTDSSGSFQIGGTYTCTPGDQVYLLASGGNPGLAPGVINPALKLLSTLGQCPNAGNFANAIPQINISEVSTVAAVYALGGFMTDATHLSSSGTALAITGLANAFQNVNLLVDVVAGAALSVTPIGNGSAPQATINTLANLLTTCVNSTGISSSCASLFTNAKDSAGNLPTDTVAAALNIAHNPGANVAALFTLANANPPFQPTLGTAPNDWTIAVTIYSNTMAGPYYPAIDATGNIWVPAYANNTLAEYSSFGIPLYNGAAISGNGLNQPYAIAIDSAQRAWVANFSYGSPANLSIFDQNSASLGTTLCGVYCTTVALDSNQNVWMAGSTSVTTIHHSTLPIAQFAVSSFAPNLALDSTGQGWLISYNRTLDRLTLPNTVTPFTQTATNSSPADLNMLAVDSTDHIWFTSGKNNSIGRADHKGNPVSPTGGYKGGGLNYPAQIAIDGSDRVWVANRDGNSISAFDNSGTPITSATGYQPSSQTAIDPSVVNHTGIRSPHGLAIDGSGNIWITNFGANSLTVFLGLATPVVTPISPTTHGQRP